MFDKSVAIIGAGLSAAVCAKALSGLIKNVQVFEKSDHIGGRLYISNEYSSSQSFTVSTPFFQNIVDKWCLDQVVHEAPFWHVEIASGETYNLDSDQTEYMVKPNMTELVNHMLTDINVQLNSEVHEIEKSGDKWRLFDIEGNYLGLFDSVIVSSVTPSQYDLINSSPELLGQIKAIQYSSVWSVVMQSRNDMKLPFDHANFIDSPLSSCNKINSNTVLIQATPEWSEQFSALSKDQASDVLKKHFCDEVQLEKNLIEVTNTQFWPFKTPINTLNEDCLFDDLTGFGACGDWCTSPRIEGAILSGFSIADKVMKYFLQDKA